MNLIDTIELFLGEYKGATVRTYSQDLKMLLQYIAGGVKLEDITVTEVTTAIQRYERRETVTSVYTVNKFIRTVRRFFNWCVYMEFLEQTPARRARFRPQPNNDVLERTMPEEVYFGLIEHFTERVFYDKPALRMLALLHFLGTGARRGGAAGLQWRDIDYPNREATITEKGQKTRTVFLDDETIAVLRRWQLQQRADEGDYVFSYRGGSLLAPSLGKFFRDWCSKAGFDKPDGLGWGMHAVRHYVGIDLQDAGVNEIEAAGIMGHSVETYREFYAAQDKERLREAALKTVRARRINRKKISTDIDFKKGKTETG